MLSKIRQKSVKKLNNYYIDFASTSCDKNTFLNQSVNLMIDVKSFILAYRDQKTFMKLS